MAIGTGNTTFAIDQTTAGWRKPTLGIDLFAKIITISPTDYPFFTMSGNVKTNNHLTQWQTRSLPARASGGNSAIEGAEWTYASVQQPSRVTNFTQIMTIGVEISGRAQAESHFGIRGLMQDQIGYRMESLKGYTENRLIQSTLVTGDTTAATQMTGLLAAISTNASTHGNDTLEENDYIDLFKDIWKAGAHARDVLVNAGLQTTIDGFNANGGTKWIATTEKEVVNLVQVYQTAFGTVRNHLSRDLEDGDGTAEIVALDFANFHKAWLRPTQMKRPDTTGDYTRANIIHELTLKFDNEAAAAKGTFLSTAS